MLTVERKIAKWAADRRRATIYMSDRRRLDAWKAPSRAHGRQLIRERRLYLSPPVDEKQTDAIHIRTTERPLRSATRGVTTDRRGTATRRKARQSAANVNYRVLPSAAAISTLRTIGGYK